MLFAVVVVFVAAVVIIIVIVVAAQGSQTAKKKRSRNDGRRNRMNEPHLATEKREAKPKKENKLNGWSTDWLPGWLNGCNADMRRMIE